MNRPESTETDEIQLLAPLDQSLMNLLDQVRARTGAARAALFLRDPETGEAVTRAAHLEKVQEIRVPPGRGIVGAVLAADRWMSWPGEAPSPNAKVMAATGYTPESVLAVPVRLNDAPVGVLELLDCALDERSRKRAEGAAARLERILGRSSLAQQLRPVGDRSVTLSYGFEGIIGASPAMKSAFDLAERVAGVDASVLITGDTGTGKELFARALHANSKRAAGELVKVDCGALPDTLIESELFGHEKGAFTGAVARAEGRVVRADGGTLFLDEVGELSRTAQTRLLRVLEDKVIQPLGGGGKPRKVDFRLISATHRDLAAMVRAGEFRADLYHRLQVVRIRLPSLHERGDDDILRLVEHFAHKHGERYERPVHSIPAAAQERLAKHRWPGNVRELSHAVESAVVLARGGVLTPDLFEFEDTVTAPSSARGASEFSGEPTLADLEQRYITWLMERYDDRKVDVSRVAGIGRSTLWRRLREMGYDTED